MDTATENEAASAVPILGTALEVCKDVDDLRNRAMAAKICKFLMEPSLQIASQQSQIKNFRIKFKGRGREIGRNAVLYPRKAFRHAKARVAGPDFCRLPGRGH